MTSGPKEVNQTKRNESTSLPSGTISVLVGVFLGWMGPPQCEPGREEEGSEGVWEKRTESVQCVCLH